MPMPTTSGVRAIRCPTSRPAGRSRTVTQEETRARLRSIAEDDAGNAASAPQGSPIQLVGDFYAACMDESRVNSLGLQPLEPILQDIDGIQDAMSLSAQIVRLQAIGPPQLR